MPIMAKDTSTFTPAPEGLYLAICCDVVEKLGVQTQWGIKDKVQIRWQTEEFIPETGKPYLVMGTFTKSLHSKGRLRAFLEAWRGRKFTKEELEGFDLEKLLGKSCQLNVVHNNVNGETYANIASVVPAGKGAQPMKVVDYVRVVDRPTTAPDNGAHVAHEDDDLPF